MVPAAPLTMLDAGLVNLAQRRKRCTKPILMAEGPGFRVS